MLLSLDCHWCRHTGARREQLTPEFGFEFKFELDFQLDFDRVQVRVGVLFGITFLESNIII